MLNARIVQTAMKATAVNGVMFRPHALTSAMATLRSASAVMVAPSILEPATAPVRQAGQEFGVQSLRVSLH